MLGIIYIILCLYSGYVFVSVYLPHLTRVRPCFANDGRVDGISRPVVVLPASFLCGTLLLTWSTYLFSYFASLLPFISNPMLWGNLISITLCITGTMYLSFKKIQHIAIWKIRTLPHASLRPAFSPMSDLAFFLAVLVLSVFLMFYTFYIKGSTIYVGNSVWSDFGPHLSVIRSFSLGTNFPTGYPHFASNNIRYHFMFQFLAGNLEYLGLRLDFAFNLPSILSMVSFFLLLYAYAIILTGKRWVGIMTAVLFFFRSSFAFFTYLQDLSGNSLSSIIKTILNNTAFIGKTTHENWGLWAQNVYVNQRHLCFSLGILLVVLIAIHPLFFKMVRRLKNLRQGINEASGSLNSRQWLNELIISRDAWLPESITRSVVLGLLLGLISFWNGAVVIASLIVLFFMAIMSKHRSEYLNAAIITVFLALAQSAFFIGTDTAAVSPMLNIGFLAADTSLLGIISYYIELLGVFPIILLISLFILPKGMRWLTLSFSAPLIMATLVQLTADINANHKFVIISVILLNIIISYFLYRLSHAKNTTMSVIAAIITVALIITGVFDLITLYNVNKSHVTYQQDSPITQWVLKNTEPDNIFLTDVHVLHPILLAGRKLFLGWTYYAWSAGYNTNTRKDIVNNIYGAVSAERLKGLVNENGIDYIVIERSNKESTEYKLNEALITQCYELAYSNGSLDIAIYKTHSNDRP